MRKIQQLLVVILLICASCKEDTLDPLADASAFINNYANMAFANYNDALLDANTLNEAIDAFVANPTSATQQAAKDAWLSARESYGTTEAFRFAGGPIDEFGDAPEGALNAWPLDEAYIDYIESSGIIVSSGIINDGIITIDKASLESLNEAGGEANISIGYHAIEFLLWGQDNTAPSDVMAGQRNYTDYTDSPIPEISNESRRAAYLVAVSELLVEHLQWVVSQWDPSISGNYRASFLAADAEEQVSVIIQSIAIFSKGELSGERMIVAYTNIDQEDEHSCFSDNTHRDIILNQEGIANIYKGSYGSVSGIGLKDLVAVADNTINNQVLALLNETALDCNAIHVPFDNAISTPAFSSKVLEAANGLRDLGDKIVEAANALGFSISAELPG